MLWFKRISLLLVALLVALATMAFILENQRLASLSFLSFKTVELPLSFFVVLAFVVGGLIGVSLGWLLSARLRLSLSSSRTQLDRYRKELEKLHAQLPKAG